MARKYFRRAGGRGRKGMAGCYQQGFRGGAKRWCRIIWSPVFISLRWRRPLRSRSAFLIEKRRLCSTIFLSGALGQTGVVLVQALWLGAREMRQAAILAFLIHVFLRVSVITRQRPRSPAAFVRQNCRLSCMQRSDRCLPLVAYILVQLIPFFPWVFS